MSEDRKHHDYSPSQLQSLEACPCYKSRESTHERTIAGTLAHNMVESGRDDNRLSDEDAMAAVECMDFVAKRKELYEVRRKEAVTALAVQLWGTNVPDHLSPIQQGGGINCEMEADARVGQVLELKETYLPVDDCVFDDYLPIPGSQNQFEHRCVESTTAGYIDSALISHDGVEADCFDFKFGRWPVEKAEDNLQGIAYMLGLMRKFPTLQRVTFHFKQPHANEITSHTFGRSQIPMLYLRVQVVVAHARKARTLGDFSMARPMVPACNFCAHIGDCPKVEELMLRVGKKFYPLEIPNDITPTKLHDRQSTALGLRLAQVCKVWAESYRSRINDRVIRRDQDVPEGFVITQNEGNRKIVDLAKFKACALKYITEAELGSTADHTFGSVEALIAEKAPRGSKTAILEQFQAEILACGAVKRGNPFSFLRAVPTKEKNTQTEIADKVVSK